MQKVILMLSGGRDSFLSACRLLDKGYQVDMVTYKNGCDIQALKSKEVAERIIKIYGDESAHFLGVRSISGYIRDFYPLYMNKTNYELYQKYGELTQSQLNCLICRTSMYILSIIICKKYGIKLIAEGGRRSQGFAIEQDSMIGRYKSLLKEYDIELIMPVYDLYDNWKLKNELLKKGFAPKTWEPQCLLGYPLEKNLSTTVMDGILKFYDDGMYTIIKDTIAENLKNSYLMNEDKPLYNEDELNEE